MNKNTMFPNLIQKIVSSNEINMIQETLHYHDSSNKIDLFTLLQYMIGAAAHEWKSYRHCAEVGSHYGLKQLNYSSLSKKLSALDFNIFKQIFELVRSKCNRITRRNLNMPKELLLIDSTTITVGKNRLPWTLYHGERAGIKLHVSYTPEMMMPHEVIETIGLIHDGPIGESLADKRFILVEDRAYFKIPRIDMFTNTGQFFVIRVKDNVKIHLPHALKRVIPHDSPVTKDITCQLGTEQSRSKQRHRMVFFKDDQNREIRVVTNLMNVSAEVIANMYKARWGIEVFFRWMKQNLNASTLFGTKKNAVFNQLYAALIAYVLIRWLFDKTKKRHIFQKLTMLSFQRLLIIDALPMDWLSEMLTFLKEYEQMTG
jgi:Transposase DDE domain